MKDNIIVTVLAALVIIGIFVATLTIRWTILRYTPCSMFTVAEAPIRCVK